MIRLSSSAQKLQALLGGAVSTTQPDVVVSYRDLGNPDRNDFEPGTKVATTNNGTAVDICDAPDPSTVREIDFISIRNNDTASVTVTVRLNNNGTSYKLIVVTLATLDHLYYSHVAGWYVIGHRGQLKNSITGLLDLSASTAGQIKFPAAQNASSDANTLDDYEEGTFTPTLGGTATYTSQLGRYVKVGRRVDFWIVLVVNVLGTGSTTTISGLPFTSVNTSFFQTIPVGYYNTLAANVIYLVAAVANNGTTITFNSSNASGASIGVTTAIFGNGAGVALSGTYEAAS